ncbi:NRDE family protein [Tenacibaculum sp. SG-28]|uniref:NRDE family protein n=1 Tax=Tenacibaculum sp. SG-28 TaxID=754426 RepID=UPI000CF4A7E6|nr:NRDE family protein [Tenacibaculum sp. SG-28]PQJ21188.1 hypothetical protein BSU00_09385 [Tenacibaculum sp. SG-28]
MCTVTYLPLGKNNFIFTSNRDEDPSREAIAPKKYLENDIALYYPKDSLAGGTWIGISEHKRLVCLLNGAFEKHQRAKSYAMSRGKVVKKLLSSVDALEEIKKINFLNIEPFTIVFVDWKNNLVAHELVWDGNTKHLKKLPNKPQIWSSSTLYNKEMRNQRKAWFSDWLQEQDRLTKVKLLEFHNDKKRGTSETSLQMKRDKVETVSVTCFTKIKDTVSLEYFDNQNPQKNTLLQLGATFQ